MDYAKPLARLRKARGLTQAEVADYINLHSGASYTVKAISHWEKGVRTPPLEQFLLMCELYGVKDIQNTFRNTETEYRNLSKLNALGKSRAQEYISMLSANSLFSETESEEDASLSRRYLKLYDVPVAAGSGSFLDSDYYEEIDFDDTVPDGADFAVKVSGDSMTPRFVDRQIIFIKAQNILPIGEVGIFALNGDAYLKKLGKGELISLNPHYKPIKIRSYDSFHIFGKVVG